MTTRMSREPDKRFRQLVEGATTDEAERRIDAGDGLDAMPGCSYQCTFCYDSDHGCAYEVTGTRFHLGIEMPACNHHQRVGGMLHNVAADEHADRLLRMAFGSEVKDRIAEAGMSVPCADCDEACFYSRLAGRWLHVETPDDPHVASPGCTCERYAVTPDPLCRQHGLEDVRSGVYDMSEDARRAINRELPRITEDR